MALLVLFGTALVPAAMPAQGKIELSVPLPELQQRVKADSNDAAAHYNVALGYWNAKKWPEAEREMRAAIALEPRFAAAHLGLAFLPFARDPHMMDGIFKIDASTDKRILDAINLREREFNRAFTIDPMVDMRIVATVAGGINYFDARTVLGSSEAALIQGFADCQEGRYADCENHLDIFMHDVGNSRKLQEAMPTQILWYHGLAAAHEQHYDVAITDFTRLVNRDSVAVRKAEEKDLIRFPIRTSEYRYFIGVFQQGAGRADQAIASYQQALEGDLSLYMAHVRLAEIYSAKKDWEHAIAERRNAVNANPDDASLQIDLGVTLGLAGRFAEAHEALKAATDALPRNADAWYWAGIADEQLGQPAEAKAAFEHVVAVAPSRLQNRVVQAKAHLAKLQ